MAALSGWAAGGKELDRLQGSPIGAVRPFTPGINPSGEGVPGASAVANPLGNGLSVVPTVSLHENSGMGSSATVTQRVTPIGKFAVVLLLFALAVFFLPKGVRGWFVIIILMGALTVNTGAIQEFQKWVGV